MTSGNGTRAAGRPLRVGILITRLEGGAGMLALRGATALDPGLFRLTVVTGSASRRLLGDAEAAGLDVILEPALRSPIDPVNDVRALRRLAVLLRRGRFDVVHTHTAKAGTLGRVAAHRVSVPRIVHTYHGFPFHEFQSAGRHRAYVAVERRLGRITDLALCVGTAVAVEAARRGLIAPERIRTIGVAVGSDDGTEPGPDRAPGAGLAAPGAGLVLPARDPAARQRARRALGLPADAIVIGAVGRLTYQKAPEDFVEMLRRLRRPGLAGVWIGDGELAGAVRRRAAADPAVRLILPGERADVPDLLPAFDIFALPSRYEGLPTVIVEAMMCGVPVVATAVNAVGDAVVPGETGVLVPPRRPDLMAAAAGYLLNSPAAAAAMAETARSRLGGRYSVSALRSALAAAYHGQPEPVREYLSDSA